MALRVRYPSLLMPLFFKKRHPELGLGASLESVVKMLYSMITHLLTRIASPWTRSYEHHRMGRVFDSWHLLK